MISIPTFVATALLTSNMLNNLKNRKRLKSYEALCVDAHDLTVALPCRNEAHNLSALLPQLAEQSLKVCEWLFLDDQSQDGSREIIEKSILQKKRVLQGQEKPQYWKGKVWAMHQILKEVHTPYVLFLDADVRLKQKDSLAALWEESRSYRQEKQAFFLSVFPSAESSLSARLLVDQIQTHLYYFLPPGRIRERSSAAVAGCGQVMLIDVEAFKKIGAFGRIKNSTHDGLQISRLFKGAGHVSEFYDGKNQFSCLFYSSFLEAFEGFSRNSFETSDSVGVVLVLSGILFWIFVLPFVLIPLALVDPFWAATLVTILYGQYRVAKEFELGLGHLPLTPVKALASVGVHLWGMCRVKCHLQGQWRGRAL